MQQLGYGLYSRRIAVRFPAGPRKFSPNRPPQLWDPLTLLYSGQRGGGALLPGVKQSGVKPITYFHLELILRISGAVLPLPICRHDVYVDNCFFSLARQPLVCEDLLTVEASRLRSDTPHSAELLCTSEQPNADISTWQHTTLTRDRPMPPAGFEPTIPGSERSQIHAPPRGHWDRHVDKFTSTLFVFLTV
jgi:hypothetical protein